MSASAPDRGLAEYRRHLVEARERASAAYDKAVMTLSGGALVVSFAFIKDVLGLGPDRIAAASILLFAAWASLVTSLGAILLSMLTSQKALRRAISQVDEDSTARPGGGFAMFTGCLNWVACGGFLLGVALLACFAQQNLKG
ncbi:MAG TPA: hypothetical protein VKM54_25145 [Myxococcota bacterium]|nr:hypothetical protein [Myxococcota bacterium]